jgi:hypothetical protein
VWRWGQGVSKPDTLTEEIRIYKKVTDLQMLQSSIGVANSRQRVGDRSNLVSAFRIQRCRADELG